MPPQTTTKPWFSRTIWLNAIMGLCSALLPFIPKLSVVGAWLSNPTHLGVIGAVWAGVAVFLRFVTKDKVQLGD